MSGNMGAARHGSCSREVWGVGEYGEGLDCRPRRNEGGGTEVEKSTAAREMCVLLATGVEREFKNKIKIEVWLL